MALTFPNVPDLPGVPTLARSTFLSVVGAGVTLAESFVSNLLGVVDTWAVLNSDGKAVLTPDNVISLDVRRDFNLPNYPVEQGAFETYNKVGRPETVMVRVSAGGSLAARRALIAQVAAIEADTNLYTIVTPEYALPRMNFAGIDHRRSVDEGAGLLIFGLKFEEIRPAPARQYAALTTVPQSQMTNPQTSLGMPDPTQTAPSAAQSIGLGNVSANVCTASDATALRNAVAAASSPLASGG